MTFLPKVPDDASAQSAPIRCVLEMTEDAQISIVVSPGCSVADAQDMLRMLTLCAGGFDHVTFVDPAAA